METKTNHGALLTLERARSQAGRLESAGVDRPRPHLMLDLETLGRAPGCVILQIGWAAFWPTLGEVAAPEVIGFSHEAMRLEGFVIDPGTADWWLKQSKEAREAVMGGTEAPNIGAMRVFSLLRSADWQTIWCKGASFDFPILQAFLGRYFESEPWDFRRERCFRTVAALVDPQSVLEPGREGLVHTAGADAAHQARYLCELWRWIGAAALG